MSAIIAVACRDFCLFVSDGRQLVLKDGEIQSISDDVRKIFKINDEVMYGATGAFDFEESLTAPLDAFPDASHITMNTALRETEKYLKGRLADLDCPRQYVIGGRDDKGRFSIYSIAFDAVQKSINKTRQDAESTKSGWVYALSAPGSVSKHNDEILKDVVSAINESKSLEELMHNLAKVLAQIAKLDISVGGKVSATVITR